MVLVVTADLDTGLQDLLEYARLQRARALRLLADLEWDSPSSSEPREDGSPSKSRVSGDNA